MIVVSTAGRSLPIVRIQHSTRKQPSRPSKRRVRRLRPCGGGGARVGPDWGPRGCEAGRSPGRDDRPHPAARARPLGPGFGRGVRRGLRSARGGGTPPPRRNVRPQPMPRMGFDVAAAAGAARHALAPLPRRNAAATPNPLPRMDVAALRQFRAGPVGAAGGACRPAARPDPKSRGR